ncbi:hypothetical protein CTAM01_09895 [Colletotrichum tamarilloi]|uniref:Uncharacterized protein n=1 Tax=Colletotrichum tamarilloi TaxID=1209934 RepID=A0ABQ9R2F1_9PEZI|nr:uncharacterized protein CTAM01_09895 [Colletotrichum tamarilloi]KAK1492478.1 hypothetical protein CTAM01_09895 [Colletotrichum tamarilloi]
MIAATARTVPVSWQLRNNKERLKGGGGRQRKVARIQTWESARLERLRQMPSPLEFVGKAQRELGVIAHVRGIEWAGAGDGAKERRETRWKGAEAGGRGEEQVRPPGKSTESNDCGRGVTFLSPRRGWGAAGDDGDGAGGASWKPLQGLHEPWQHRSTDYCLPTRHLRYPYGY